MKTKTVQSSAPVEKEIPPAAKSSVQWWQTQNSKKAFVAMAAVAFISLLIWFFAFRPYVSTDDARVDASIIKIANCGTSGQIEKVSVKEGDIVHENAVLVELDHRAAEAQLSRAKARANYTSADLNRMESIAAQHGISQQQLDRVRAEAMTAQADLRLAEIALEHTYLKSPTVGIVIKKNAEIGNILETNQTAVILADVSQAWISANIEETSVARVKPGQKVKIYVDEGGTLTGRVSEVRKAAASAFAFIPSDNASGNFIKVVQRIPVRIELDPHPGRILRVGQSVEISIKAR